MEPIFSGTAPTLSADDLDTLRRARRTLESKSLTMKLTGVVGAPIEKVIAKLPAFANDKIQDATRLALEKCLQAALRTLGAPAVPAAPGASDPSDAPGSGHAAAPARPRNRLHKLAVATTGAAGGAFGLFALPVELPVTTTLMFRSICDIARSEGECLSSPEAQLHCLAVLGMGGGLSASATPTASGAPADTGQQDADYGYFVLRGALAQAVSKASTEMASKGFAVHGSAALVRLVQAIAARFSVQVTEQAAAKSIPALGAVLGAGVNTLFIDHFQQAAHAHFAIRRLERRYGQAAVEAAYRAV
ncbi:MAG: hypothetical protein GAK40_00243 [Burkholderia plantarii]|nr:MAG: hypothetical protein GAK40_00243 [Burkholderia plantarii]